MDGPERDCELTQAYAQVARLKKLEAIRAQLLQERDELQHQLEPLKSALAKESFDVYKLEHDKIGSALSALLGTREKRLEKERAEAASAHMRHRLVERALEDVERRLNELEAEQAALRGSREIYMRLYAQKKRQLLVQNEDAAQRILALTERMAACKSVLKEIEEAKLAGQRVETWLCSAMSTLQVARGWDRWSSGEHLRWMQHNGLRGNLAAEGFKLLSEQEARADAEKARHMMSRFQQELADIRLDKKTEAAARQMTMNWGVRSYVYDSMSSVGSTRTGVRAILKELEKLSAEETESLRRIKRELETLVVHAPQTGAESGNI